MYILSFLGKVYGIQNIGFYRDDGLACLRKISRPASDKIWKDMIRTFWENSGLKITITTNLKIVNFLDFTFNLCTGKYQPYSKPNDTPTYINLKRPRNRRISLSNGKVWIQECSTCWFIASRSQLMNNSMLVRFALRCKKCKYEIPTEHKIGA